MRDAKITSITLGAEFVPEHIRGDFTGINQVNGVNLTIEGLSGYCVEQVEEKLRDSEADTPEKAQRVLEEIASSL